MAIIDMAAERAAKQERKDEAVTALLDWIRDKASTAGVGGTVDWGALKFVVARDAAAPAYSGVYSDYPINSSFPTDVNTSITPVVLTGDTVDTDTTITLASTEGLVVDMGVSDGGVNIPAGAIIESIDSATEITISVPAIGTASVPITFTDIWTSVLGDNVQETLRNDGFDRGTRVDIAVAQGSEILYTIFVVDQELLARDIVDTNSRELSRIMRKKILYAKVDTILEFVEASTVPEKFPGFVF